MQIRFIYTLSLGLLSLNLGCHDDELPPAFPELGGAIESVAGVADAQSSVCGDQRCDASESPASCELDCAYCGDLLCNLMESSVSCPSDCGGVPPSAGGETGGAEGATEVGAAEAGSRSALCGDGLCDEGEEMSSCPEDCGSPPLPPGPVPDPSQELIGYVDSLSQRDDGQWVVSGWACHQGWEPSVEVAFYADGPEGEGTLIKRSLADSEQEEAVGRACGVEGGAHRYRISFSASELMEFAGARLFVHGVSPIGAENSALTNSGDFYLPGQRPNGGGVGDGGAADDLPVPLNQISWLHTDVSQWPITSTLTVSFQGATICLSYDKAEVWPPSTIRHNSGDYDIEVVANPWVILNYQGTWYAATWEWLVVGSTCKNMSSVAGDHIKQFAHIPEDWTPSSGERLFFMVSGLARVSQVANIQERTNLVEVTWP